MQLGIWGLQFNSLWQSLGQVMARRLFSAKPLPEPMMPIYQFDPWEQISVKFSSQNDNFHSTKCISKCRLPPVGHVVPASVMVQPSWSLHHNSCYCVVAQLSSHICGHSHSLKMQINAKWRIHHIMNSQNAVKNWFEPELIIIFFLEFLLQI